MIPPRLEGESNYAYHKRLVNGKLVDRTLSDEDYSELSVAVYGQEYSSDVARRMMYGSQRTIALAEDSEASSIVGDDMLLELQRKKNDIIAERQKLQSVKQEMLREVRQKSRYDLFAEQIGSAMERLPLPEFNCVPETTGDSQWILGIGDIHYGATFKSVNNEYSRSECERRFNVLLDRVAGFVQSDCISHLTILNVADSIEGILRLVDLQINDIPVVECVVEVSRILASFINALSAYCDITYYHVPSANHSQTRPLGSKASALATEDLEQIIVSYVSDLLANNPRVNVVNTVGKEYVEFDIAGMSCIAMHGHQVKDVPSCLERLTKLHRKFYDYVFLGHRHAAEELVVGESDHHNVEVLTIPSFIGSDAYSDKLMAGNKSMAKLYEFNAENGHIGSKNIILN